MANSHKPRLTTKASRAMNMAAGLVRTPSRVKQSNGHSKPSTQPRQRHPSSRKSRTQPRYSRE